jgi:hypothetical protein
VQKLKMKIAALASRLGVLAKNKKRSEQEGGRRERGGAGREDRHPPTPTVTFARTPPSTEILKYVEY